MKYSVRFRASLLPLWLSILASTVSAQSGFTSNSIDVSNSAYTVSGSLAQVCQNFILSNQYSLQEGVQQTDFSATSLINWEDGSTGIYPNPVSKFLNVEISVFPLYYKVINSLGRTVESGVLSNNLNTINFSEWENGLYVLFLYCDHVTTAKKIIKHE